MIEVLFPTASDYDRDGDGLVDIEISFRDTESGLDEQSLRIVSDRPLGPAGTGGTDLLASFAIVERDSLHIVLKETTEALLPSGGVEIRTQLSDRLGNETTSRLQLDLPAGSFHKHLPSPIPENPEGIEMLPVGPGGGPAGLLLSFNDLIPFDPYALSYGDPISTGGVFNPVDGEWDPTTQRMFFVSVAESEMLVLNPLIMQVEAPIQIAARSIGISRGPSGLLYIACSTTPATVSVVDPVLRQEVRTLITSVVDPDNPGQPAFIHTPRLPAEGDRAYIPLNVTPGGVLVLDPFSGEVLRTLDVNPDHTLNGIAVESDLDRERGLLFLSELLNPGGLIVLDTHTELIVARLVFPSFVGKFPILSPSQQRLFLTLGRNIDDTPENWLIDATTFQILSRIPVGGAGFTGANNGVFRSDGQLIFAVSGNGMSVYLNRE